MTKSDHLLKLCFDCFVIFEQSDSVSVECPTCGHNRSMENYTELLDSTRKIVRYGYHYRSIYEQDYGNNPSFKHRYYLGDLNEAITFIAVAAISGIIGNFTYDLIKKRINDFNNQNLIIEIDDPELKKLLENEAQQERFIKYLTEFRNGNFTTSKHVLAAINDEIEADEKAEKLIKSEFVQNILKKLEQKELKKKKSSKTKSILKNKKKVKKTRAKNNKQRKK